MNPARTSATPSPSTSRSNVIRFALGTPAPARLHQHLHDPAPDFRHEALDSLGGAFDSATRTSPFGSTYSQRGCDRSLARAVTVSPAAATGLPPSGQPTAGAMAIVGTEHGLDRRRQGRVRPDAGALRQLGDVSAGGQRSGRDRGRAQTVDARAHGGIPRRVASLGSGKRRARSQDGSGRICADVPASPARGRDRARASGAALRASGRSGGRRFLSRAAIARHARPPRPRGNRLRAAAAIAAVSPSRAAGVRRRRRDRTSPGDPRLARRRSRAAGGPRRARARLARALSRRRSRRLAIAIAPQPARLARRATASEARGPSSGLGSTPSPCRHRSICASML